MCLGASPRQAYRRRGPCERPLRPSPRRSGGTIVTSPGRTTRGGSSNGSWSRRTWSAWRQGSPGSRGMSCPSPASCWASRRTGSFGPSSRSAIRPTQGSGPSRNRARAACLESRSSSRSGGPGAERHPRSARPTSVYSPGSRARTSSRSGEGGHAIARSGRVVRPVRRASDQPTRHRNGGGDPRERSIQVPSLVARGFSILRDGRGRLVSAIAAIT
jgi:hypothetical protein